MAREGRAVANQRWLSRVVWLVLVVFGVSALAYFVAPAASLRIVGIASDPTERFLLRSLRNGLVWGAITYLVASSLVDLAAYMGGIVSGLSVPSAAVRIALAVWLVVLQRRGG